MRALAVDTGPSTGFALYDFRTDYCEAWQEDLAEYGRNTGGCHDALDNILRTIDFNVLIVERFEFRRDDQMRDKIDYLAAELVGVCKLYAYQEGLRQSSFVLQGASLIGKKAFWSDDNEKVKKVGLYNSKAYPHGMDGLRHLLYWTSFTLDDSRFLERLK